MNKKESLGELSCKVCGQSFQSSINYLSAPVDVYSDWIDACESVAQQAIEGEEPTAEDRDFSTYASERPKATARAGADLDDDDDY